VVEAGAGVLGFPAPVPPSEPELPLAAGAGLASPELAASAFFAPSGFGAPSAGAAADDLPRLSVR
jgi:hypothetical protein